MIQAQLSQVKTRLESLLERIEGRQDISTDLAAVEVLTREISGSAPTQLVHFLQNRSNQKALEFMENGVVVEDPQVSDGYVVGAPVGGLPVAVRGVSGAQEDHGLSKGVCRQEGRTGTFAEYGDALVHRMVELEGLSNFHA